MRLYSTLQRTKVDLPEPPGPVGIYTCGPTVYQRIHIGNARPFVLSMWLRAWLRHRGYEVTLVENITDINDKIYLAAPGASSELAAQAAQWYIDDTDLLGLGRPDHEPRATESVEPIKALIAELVSRDLAYAAGGDVYFRVAGFPEYGSLSGQRPDQVQEQDGETSPLKEDPRDFALWKAHKEGEDTVWDSPWGPGRPGWHIECSAMAEQFLGPRFDIHLGGLDLVFPHHENELAQSRGAGREFAHIWMHNGMLELTGEKMSKSLGNIATLREVISEWGRATVLVYFLGAHWRSPIDFSDASLIQAKSQVDALRATLLDAEEGEAPGWDRFMAALEDDFNTPQALAVMHEWMRSGLREPLQTATHLFLGDFPRARRTPSDDLIALAEERSASRERGDYEEADRFRAKLAELGWEIRDTPGGYSLEERE